MRPFALVFMDVTCYFGAMCSGSVRLYQAARVMGRKKEMSHGKDQESDFGNIGIRI